MAMNSPVQQSFTSEGTPNPGNRTAQPKAFTSSGMQEQRNPSTYRPPDDEFFAFEQPREQHLAMTVPNMGTNIFPQRTEPEPAPLRASESPYGGGQTFPGGAQIQNSRTQRPQAQTPRALHFLPTMQPNQVSEMGHRDNNMDRRRRHNHLRRKTRWQHRLSQYSLAPNVQFEATLSVLLLSVAFQKYICQAGICRELEHALVSVSAVQTLGFQISPLPTARQFLSPWGRIRAQLHTALVIELLLEGNPRVEVGNIIVLEDRFFAEHGLKVPLILGRAFCNNHLGRNLRQPALVPLGQTQNWFQIPSASSDNSVGGFRSPVTPVTPSFYPRNNQSQSRSSSPNTRKTSAARER
ncbi:hypothetical protein QBC43DRAFT_120611 [Cladorrhinum sp. PSN259]|nr:hypothetical protein QBC43DRAFT_120611 [Cladorrhinum sp. PSN259]